MKCPKCDGRGFEEFEHGLIMVACESCEGTGEISESLSDVAAEANAFANALMPQLEGERQYGSNIRTEPANQPIGKPLKPRKRKRRSKRA